MLNDDAVGGLVVDPKLDAVDALESPAVYGEAGIGCCRCLLRGPELADEPGGARAVVAMLLQGAGAVYIVDTDLSDGICQPSESDRADCTYPIAYGKGCERRVVRRAEKDVGDVPTLPLAVHEGGLADVAILVLEVNAEANFAGVYRRH